MKFDYHLPAVCIKEHLGLNIVYLKLVSVNILQSYKQERGCLVHFVRLSTTLLKDEESAQDNHVLVCNFAKYLPILLFFTDTLINKRLLICLLPTYHALNT